MFGSVLGQAPRYRILVWVVGLFMAINTATRLGLIGLEGDLLNALPWRLGPIVVVGLFYDAAAASYVLIPFALTALLLPDRPWGRQAHAVVVTVLLWLCLFGLLFTSVAEVLRRIKSNSSKWIHETDPARRGFAWQAGYGAFAVSYSQVDQVKAYLAGQAEHQAESALLAVDFERIEDFLLAGQEFIFAAIEGVLSEPEEGSDHDGSFLRRSPLATGSSNRAGPIRSPLW